MAVRTKSGLKATKNSRFPDNSSGAVSAANSRDMWEDAADSFAFLTDVGGGDFWPLEGTAVLSDDLTIFGGSKAFGIGSITPLSDFDVNAGNISFDDGADGTLSIVGGAVTIEAGPDSFVSIQAQAPAAGLSGVQMATVDGNTFLGIVQDISPGSEIIMQNSDGSQVVQLNFDLSNLSAFGAGVFFLDGRTVKKGIELVDNLGAIVTDYSGFTAGTLVPKGYVDSVGGILSAEVTVSSAQILNSFSSPVVLVAAPGAGKVIRLVSLTMYLDYNSAAYATNTNTVVSCGGANLLGASMAITAVADTYFFPALTLTTIAASSINNQPLLFSTNTGNPTAGDSTIKFFITYKILTP